MAPLSKYETAVVEEALKKSIIDLAKCIFGQKHPHGHGWAVVATRDETQDPEYTVHLVVEGTPGQLGNCITLVRGPCHQPDIPALESMLEALQELGWKH